jgi:ubiquinone/menaquinone biosynthesis C-methylase UbiE
MGREIAKVMGAAGADWLERNSRPQEENTDFAVTKFPITDSSIVADIGAGTGYYTFRIASKVPKGKVYAVEIQDELISILTNKIKDLRNKNVEVIKGDAQSPNLPANSVDLVVMVDVYHELLYPREMLGNIRKALKPNGKILLLEYKAEDASVAIKKLHKMSVAQVTRELKANKFSLIYKGDFLPIQHFLIFRKRND